MQPRSYPRSLGFAIGGERVAPQTEVVVRSPFDGAEVGRCGAATAAEVERALAAAAGAREAMAAMPAWRRSQALGGLEAAVGA
ncbi:MAG: aldehyde dehydrogenase family protein, partial [Terriglobales bacterium]